MERRLGREREGKKEASKENKKKKNTPRLVH